MKILVTGGTGFLGSAMVKELVSRGHQIRILDDNSRGALRRLEGVDYELIEGDVRDASIVDIATRGCEQVWHLAYVNGTRFFYEKPDLVLDVAIKGMLNTVEAAKKHGVQRYVYASSSEVYNQAAKVPTDESVPCVIPDVRNPRFSYGGGKLIGELMAFHSAGRYMESVVFRPHNVYGPDMGNEHVIPELIRKVYDASKRIPKHEQLVVDVQCSPSPGATRSFCYVTDAARGAVMAGLDGASGEVYHVGTDEEELISHLAIHISILMGRPNVATNPVPGPSGGPARRCPDITQLENMGYAPRVRLIDGLQQTIDWYVARFEEESNGQHA